MKKLREFVTIKNLDTDQTTTVDDEGNIEGLDDIFGADLDDDRDPAIRADGSHDGLDDIDWGDTDPFADEDADVDASGDFMSTDELAAAGGDESLEGEDVAPEDELAPEEGELGLDGEDAQPEDPDFQGVIRTVTGACLVYKRKTEEGTYEELWIYNIGKNMRNEVKIRRAILAGTDIPQQDVSSQDGTQNVESTTVGNVQYLRITGLPN